MATPERAICSHKWFRHLQWMGSVCIPQLLLGLAPELIFMSGWLAVAFP
jgi:hypothetical protein